MSDPGCREGTSGSLGLQRPPRFFQEALPKSGARGAAPGPRLQGQWLHPPPSPSSSAGHPGRGGGLAAGGARERAHSSSGTLPPDSRPHGCGASPGGGEGGSCFWAWAWAWGCCGRRLIPCPILECYSVTDNRVTRAAADVLTASIGRRNKEGRGLSAGLSQPGDPPRSDWLRRLLGGSEEEEGAGSRAKCDRCRVLGPPRRQGRGSLGLRTEFPPGSWYCGGCNCGKQRSKATQEVKRASGKTHSLRNPGHTHLPLPGGDGWFRQGCSHDGTMLTYFFSNPKLQITQNSLGDRAIDPLILLFNRSVVSYSL